MTDTIDLVRYTAVDVDADAAELQPTYGLEGADEDFFSISNDVTGNTHGTLTFATDHKPDYETQKSYSITITASDGKLTGRLDVTVTVTNAEDGGTVKFSQLEPQVGRSVTATVTDQDGGVSNSVWQWYRGGNPAAEGGIIVAGVNACTTNVPATENVVCSITDATSATYIPVDLDVDQYLTAGVTYKDKFVTLADAVEVPDPAQQTSDANVQPVNDANTAPEFGDQDPDPNVKQTEIATREVPEDAKKGANIGEPVSASDADSSEKLLYTLGGTDAASFDIDRTSGQLIAKDKMDGSVTLSSDSPAVGEAITATLEDGNEVTDVTWQWSNHAIGDEAYADIEGATDASYTPTAADFGST